MNTVQKDVSFKIELVGMSIQLAEFADALRFVRQADYVQLIIIHEFFAEKGLRI